ncbi:hypothetical protein AHiyo6_02530 [Arthrobacter sp. Hiyo6]|nr:hypothetical protein AHiyo6_02530 [Arthrobacter sp. Hiyo6]
MDMDKAPRLTVVQPGQGREGSLGSIGVVFKLFGEHTNEQISIVEHPFLSGLWSPRTPTLGRTSTRSSLKGR